MKTKKVRGFSKRWKGGDDRYPTVGLGGDPKLQEDIQKATLRYLETKTEAEVAKVAAADLQAQSLKHAADAQEQLANTKTSEARFEKVRKILVMIGSFIKNFISTFGKGFGVLWYRLSGYVAILVVLWFLFVFLPGLKKKKRRNPRTRRNQKKPSLMSRFMAWISRIIGKMFPSSSMSMFSRWNPMGSQVTSIPRPLIGSGRCDNVTWKETGADGTPGFCTKTYQPEKLKWLMEMDRMPELAKLPEPLQKQITQNGDKLQVYIPYAQQGTFYVPQCSQAYTITKDSTGKEVQESAGHLFEDTGLACLRTEKSSLKLEEGMVYRRKDADNLKMTLADNVKCS